MRQSQFFSKSLHPSLDFSPSTSLPTQEVSWIHPMVKSNERRERVRPGSSDIVRIVAAPAEHH
jgi:hypothetical protein